MTRSAAGRQHGWDHSPSKRTADRSSARPSGQRHERTVAASTNWTIRPGATTYSVVLDDHYERLRRRALEALADNENGTISDDDLIYVLETTCGLLERTHEAARVELWEASADFDSARYAIPVSEIGPQDDAEEAFRQTLKARARARARSALS